MKNNDMFGVWAEADLVPPENRQPIARSTDPVTSHIAADELTKSGRRTSQKQVVLDLVRAWPSKTSAELAQIGRVDRYLVARRLPDLCRDGLVVRGSDRVCEVTKNRAITWNVK